MSTRHMMVKYLLFLLEYEKGIKFHFSKEMCLLGAQRPGHNSSKRK